MKKALGFLSLLIVYANGAQASDSAGTASGNLLLLRQGSRSAAIGQAYTAVGTDLETLFHNPAGLGRLDKLELSVSERSSFADIRQGYAAGVMPLGSASSSNVKRFGSLGFSVEYADYGNLLGRDKSGASTGNFSADDELLLVGYGQPLGHGISIGASGKLYKFKIDDKKAEGGVGDAGIMMDIWESFLTAGFSISNFGGDINYQSSKDKAPVKIDAGVAFKPCGNSLTVATDFEHPIDDTVRLKAGAEWWVSRVFAIRGGYDSTFDIASGLSAGVGLLIRDFEVGYFPIYRIMINYAFIPTKDLGYIQQVGLSFKFDAF